MAEQHGAPADTPGRSAKRQKLGDGATDVRATVLPPLLALPADAQSRILLLLGRQGRAAYSACQALRHAFLGAWASPPVLARFCVTAWGRNTAALHALRSCRNNVALAATPEQREQRACLLLRSLAASGANLHYDMYSLLELTLELAPEGALLRELLATCGRGPAAGLAADLLDAASAGNGPMVAALAAAITAATGEPVHQYTLASALQRALWSEPETGSAAVRALLAQQPPLRVVSSMLSLAAKGSSAECVALLLDSGAVPSGRAVSNACFRGCPDVVGRLARAAVAGGGMSEAAASHALRMLCYPGGAVASPHRARCVRLLVAAGADVGAYEGALLAQASLPLKDQQQHEEGEEEGEEGSEPAAQGAGGRRPMRAPAPTRAAWRRGGSGVGEEEGLQCDRMQQRLKQWALLLEGADADAALLAQVTSREWGHPHEHPHLLQPLLAMGVESAAGAARALVAALRAGRAGAAGGLMLQCAVGAPEVRLVVAAALGSAAAAGAGPAEAAALAAVEATVQQAAAPPPPAEAEAAQAGGDGDGGGDGQAGGVGWAAAGGNAAAALEPPRWEWLRQLAAVGLLRGSCTRAASPAHVRPPPPRSQSPMQAPHSAAAPPGQGCAPARALLAAPAAHAGGPEDKAVGGGVCAAGRSVAAVGGEAEPEDKAAAARGTRGKAAAAGRGLAGTGCWPLERALVAACERGDAGAVAELASLGVASDASCVAGFWRALGGGGPGHAGCVRALLRLGAVPPELGREAAAWALLRRDMWEAATDGAGGRDGAGGV